MDGHKILHRMEKAFWNPPIFSFTIERHGRQWVLLFSRCPTMDLTRYKRGRL
jgi:hypothetical protein